ncbi:MAG: sugar phosphate isomerase/epimerase [Pirellulaceae bacterium]|nr:sugar phosphate isomerase/epimerase [Pirellulaceae bacterium]
MFLNLNAQSLGVSGRQSELIELALTYGFKGIDTDIDYLVRQTELHDFEHAARFFSSANLRIGGFDLPVCWQGDDAQFEEDLSRLSAIAEVANRIGAIGCRTVVMPASDERPYHENFEFHRQRFTRIAETLAEHSIRLGLDFLATPRHREGLQYQFIHSPDALVTLAKTVGMENVGIAVDVWQWQVAGATWEPLRELSANEIVSVRIADVPAEFDPATIADEDRLLASDGGTIDVVSIIKLLAEKGFEGPLTPYPDPSQFNGITRDSLVRQAADSVQLNSLQEESLEEPEAELVASGSEDAESVS